MSEPRGLPVAEPAPAGARCALHPSIAATVTCPRCGNFACQACVVPIGDRLCCTSCAGATEHTLGSEGARLAANMVDSLVLFLPSAVCGTGVALYLAGVHEPLIAALALGGFALTLAVVSWNVYLVAQNGQSFGKRLLHLRVVRSNHTPASWQRIVFLRNVLPGILGGIPFAGSVFSLVDALFIFRPDRRCLHDHIADTIVVQVGPPGGRADPPAPYTR